MTKNVITIDPETPLKTIENLLVEHNIGRLPVVAGNKLWELLQGRMLFPLSLGKFSQVV